MSTTELPDTQPTSIELDSGGATDSATLEASTSDITADHEPVEMSQGDRPDEAPEPAEDLGELMWADPAELVVGVNTRTEARLSAHFVADIRDRGVREPITVRRREDGALVVRKGQRRTLAAVKVGLPRVRVLVESAPRPGRGGPTGADRAHRRPARGEQPPGRHREP